VNAILGSLIVLGSVIGGFTLSNGQIAALFQPYELLVIGGSALGAFVIANPIRLVVGVLKGIPGLLAGAKYSKQSYLDVFGLLFALLDKARRDGIMSIEGDIEAPETSAIFAKYPKILKDHHAVEFVSDYLRLMIAGNVNPFELDSLMTLELETHHGASEEKVHALTRVADALPGFGIVAAVLGIVITMSSLGGPVEEIGHHVAAALVGTFLGILLAYGFVGPMSIAMEHKANEEAKFFEVIKTCLLASVQGYNPKMVVEFGRKAMPVHLRPGFAELEEHIRGSKA
jgi:chemotaxis protein MotA